MLNVISDDGQSVDWWFMYKLPHGQKIPKEAAGNLKNDKLSGLNYLYYQPGGAGLALSSNILGSSGALYNTLKQIFATAEAPGSTSGWLLYNDEIPNTKKNNEERGHCKGVLAFDKKKDQGIWLLHSTPRFPLEKDACFPVDEQIYAQTFIAISLNSYKAATGIARQLLREQDPQLYSYKLPDDIEADQSDPIYQLCKGVAAPAGPLTSQISFQSRGGKSFQSIAKNRTWGKDFWIDLVGPSLGVDLAVETWRRGKIPGEEDLGDKLDVEDVGGIDLSPLGVASSWPYTRDHAKWAVEVSSGESRKPDWVCVADINRQVSQEKRGGGAICFQDAVLQKALSSIDVFPK